MTTGERIRKLLEEHEVWEWLDEVENGVKLVRDAASAVEEANDPPELESEFTELADGLKGLLSEVKGFQGLREASLEAAILVPLLAQAVTEYSIRRDKIREKLGDLDRSATSELFPRRPI